MRFRSHQFLRSAQPCPKATKQYTSQKGKDTFQRSKMIIGKYDRLKQGDKVTANVVISYFVGMTVNKSWQ